MEANITDRIETLLMRHYDGTVSEEEAAAVADWLARSEENRRVAEQVYALNLSVDALTIQVDTEGALGRLNRQLNRDVAGHRRRLAGLWLQRIAAVLFVPLLLAYLFSFLREDAPDVQWIEVKTEAGMTASLRLPDSSSVVLNAASRLRYPSWFCGEERRVQLEGEAYFSVVNDRKKRFVVATPGDAEVRVYGTEFNVEAYSAEGQVKTTLVSGKVGFAYAGASRELSLTPGKQVVYRVEEGTVTVRDAFVEGAVAWKDGKMIFKNTPFDEVLHALGKRFQVEFVVKRQALHACSFTGKFGSQSLEKILDHFTFSSGIRFRYAERKGGDAQPEKERIEVY